MSFRTSVVVTILAAVLTGQAVRAGTETATSPAPQVQEFAPLMVGDPAPALTVGAFLRGEPVMEYKPGHVYIVEFWATWCGPCKKSIPHLSELQKKHAGKLTIIGVSVWERQFDQSKVEPFVEQWSDKMTYTVAKDLVTPPGAGVEPSGKWTRDNGAMAARWMNPTFRGIPTAFIIDGRGIIAAISNPLEPDFDSILEEVLAGTWDVVAASSKYRQSHEVATISGTFRRMLTSAPAEKESAAYDYIRPHIKGKLAGEPDTLTDIAWLIVDGKNQVVNRDADIAMAAATLANAAGAERDPWRVQVLAHAHALKGEKPRAIELMHEALELAKDDESRVAFLKERLALLTGGK